MITKYYNASNNFSAPIIREPRHPKPIQPQRPSEQEAEQETRLAHGAAHAPSGAQPEREDAPAPKRHGGLLGGLLGGRGGKKEGGILGFLDGLESDDLILLGLLLILIGDSDDDFLTLIIGYLFLSGL